MQFSFFQLCRCLQMWKCIQNISSTSRMRVYCFWRVALNIRRALLIRKIHKFPMETELKSIMKVALAMHWFPGNLSVKPKSLHIKSLQHLQFAPPQTTKMLSLFVCICMKYIMYKIWCDYWRAFPSWFQSFCEATLITLPCSCVLHTPPWEWYWFSNLSLRKKVISCISQNVI